MSGRAEPFFNATTASRRTASLSSFVKQLVQQRAHVVHVARMVARELLEREQRRAAHGRAVVLEPAAQQLLLRAEPELADRAVRDRALAEVRRARRGFELVVPLRAQLRQLALVALLRERVGLSRSFGERVIGAAGYGAAARRRRSPTAG